MAKYAYMEPTTGLPRHRHIHLCLGDAAMTLCGQLAVGNWSEIGGDDTGTEATCRPCLAARERA